MKKRHGKHVAHWYIFRAMLLKHYKILFKSKTTLLTMVAGPLIVLLLTGLAFNTGQTQALHVGIYSSTNEELAGELTTTLKEQFSTEAMPTPKLCKELVTKGYLNVCLILPDPANRTSLSYENEVKVYSDNTQYNLAYIIIDQIDSTISEKSGTISKRYVTELTTALQTVRSQLSNTQTQAQTLISTTEQVQSSINNAQTASNIPIHYDTSETPYNLGRSFNELVTSANSVNTAVKKIDDVQESMRDDYNELTDDIEGLADTYYDECTNGTATDCAEQEQVIESLKEEQKIINNYLAPLETLELGDDSIELQIALQNITPKMESLQNTLTQADTAITGAKENLGTISTALQTSTNNIHTISSTLQNMQTGIDRSVQALENIRVTDPDAISSPITASYNELNAGATTTHKLFPLLLALFIMMVSILLSATFIIIEKKSSAFIRTNIAPVFRHFLPSTALITLLSIILVETTLLALLAQIIFDISLIAQTGYLLIAFVVSALVFLLIGMTIGFLLNNEESVTLTAVFLSTTLLLFSPIIFPLQSMTPVLAKIASYNPYVLTSELFKKILLFDAGFEVFGKTLLALLIYVGLFAAFLTASYLLATKKS